MIRTLPAWQAQQCVSEQLGMTDMLSSQPV